MVTTCRYDGYANFPLERGRVWMCCGRGVLANMLVNTPLHPSQEGNRTAPAFKICVFCYSSIKHVKINTQYRLP